MEKRRLERLKKRERKEGKEDRLECKELRMMGKGRKVGERE